MKRSLEIALEKLGCPNERSFIKIRDSYKDLMKKYHPDNKGPDASEEKTKLINDAFNTVKVFYEDGYFDNSHDENENIWHQKGYQDDISELSVLFDTTYCWNPNETQYRDLEKFIQENIDSMSNLLIKKYEHVYLRIIGEKLKRDKKLFNLLREQWIKPYFALISQLDKIDDKISSVNSEEFIECDVYLRGTLYEGRTKNIEKCCVGDSVILCAYGDNEDYPEKIEVLDKEYNSLGTIPVELAVCITPLFLNGYLDMEGKIKEIISRQDKGQRTGTADMCISLNRSIKKSDNIDKKKNNSEKIHELLSRYSEYFDDTFHLLKCTEEKELIDFIINNYIYYPKNPIYDKKLKKYFERKSKSKRVFYLHYCTSSPIDRYYYDYEIHSTYPHFCKEEDDVLRKSILAFTNWNVLSHLSNIKYEFLCRFKDKYLFNFDHSIINNKEFVNFSIIMLPT